MKLIEEVSIWNNGVNKKATILNAYAINLVLNESANFYYCLLNQNEDGTQGEVLTQGNNCWRIGNIPVEDGWGNKYAVPPELEDKFYDMWKGIFSAPNGSIPFYRYLKEFQQTFEQYLIKNQ